MFVARDHFAAYTSIAQKSKLRKYTSCKMHVPWLKLCALCIFINTKELFSWLILTRISLALIGSVVFRCFSVKHPDQL